MWVWGIVAGGVAIVAWSLLRLAKRSRTRTIDVGRVSDAWLAEERGRSSDS